MGDRPLRRRPPCRNFGGDARAQELAGNIRERARRISALHREQLADIAEFDRAEGWRGDGAVSMVAWVTGQCGVSTSTARQWVRSAANLESLPCLAEGLASGALSLDLVEPLAEVASPASDAALREASAHWSVRQARELVAWHRAQVESGAGSAAASAESQAAAASASADGAADGDAGAVGGSAAREFERRTLRFNDTRRSVWVAFTKDDYAVAKSVLVGRVMAQSASAETGSDSIGYTPYDQRLYDALLDLFRAASGRASAVERGSRPSPGRGPCAAGVVGGLFGTGRGRDRRRGSRVGRGGPAAGLRCQCGPLRRGSRGVDPRSGSGPARSDGGAAGGDRAAGQGVPVPGVHLHGVHERAPCPALGRRWPDEPRQPGDAVRSAPPCRARVGVGRIGERRRRIDLHQPARANRTFGALADVETVVGPPASAVGSERSDASLRGGGAGPGWAGRGWAGLGRIRRSGAPGDRSRGSAPSNRWGSR